MSKTSSILNFGPKMSRLMHFYGVKFGNSTGVKDLPNEAKAGLRPARPRLGLLGQDSVQSGTFWCILSLTGGPTDLLWSKKRHVTNGGSN